ncbi:hypothetical protein IGJ55_002741 [Enterococcus sp. AZ170]|uniref:DUF3239 domain-containing protein n=1 Tax=Enterococcus sp. AZ170 TaxID=2774747 RepID=UPI003D3017BC
MLSQHIGNKGEKFNLSQASSSVNREADIDRIKKYDEFGINDVPKFTFPMFIIFLIGIRLMVENHYIFGIIITILPIILFLFRRFTYISPTDSYKNGLITPAIITAIESDKVEILYLAPMNNGDDDNLIFGCKKVKINKISGSFLSIGEKVPCVSLFNPFFGPIKNCWSDFDSRPLVWGYESRHIIDFALLALDNDRKFRVSYWEILDNIKIVMEKKEYNKIIFFDENYNVVIGDNNKEIVIEESTTLIGRIIDLNLQKEYSLKLGSDKKNDKQLKKIRKQFDIKETESIILTITDSTLAGHYGLAITDSYIYSKDIMEKPISTKRNNISINYPFSIKKNSIRLDEEVIHTLPNSLDDIEAIKTLIEEVLKKGLI